MLRHWPKSSTKSIRYQEGLFNVYYIDYSESFIDVQVKDNI